MELRPGDRLVLSGDSITAAGHDPDDPDDLGEGYVRALADLLDAHARGIVVRNHGRDGDTVGALARRWEAVLADRPTVLGVQVGVNDTLRRYLYGARTTTPAFERAYRDLLGRARGHGVRHLVLVTPFLVPLDQEQRGWLADLDPKAEAVRRLAAEHGAVLVEAGDVMAGVPGGGTTDAVHPTRAGARALAEAWSAFARTADAD